MPAASPAASWRMRRSPPYQHQWIASNKLSKGEYLKAPDGQIVTADGGITPKQHDGWMWDLTVPGNNDHDFYVIPNGRSGDTISSAPGAHSAGEPILVHNENVCPQTQINPVSDELSLFAYQARQGSGIGWGRNVAVARVPGFNDPVTGDLVVGFSKSSKGIIFHSEDDIIQKLTARGFSLSDVTALFSERSPCPLCRPKIFDEVTGLNPGTPITYVVPDGPGSTDALIAKYQDALGRP